MDDPIIKIRRQAYKARKAKLQLDKACENVMPDEETVINNIIEELEIIEKALNEKGFDTGITNEYYPAGCYAKISVTGIGVNKIMEYIVTPEGCNLNIRGIITEDDDENDPIVDEIKHSIAIPSKRSKRIVQDFADTFYQLTKN